MENGSRRKSFPFFHKGERVAVFIASLVLVLATFIPWGFTKHPAFIGGWLSTTLLYFWIVLIIEVAFVITVEFSWLKRRQRAKNR